MCALHEVQIPLVAALLLCGSLAKLIQLIRTGTVDTGLGPAVLFPTRLRWPMAIAVSVIECAIGVGLIVTAGDLGAGVPATAVRLAAGLLFLVATSALIELWASRPDVGCGCFGDFSTTPVSIRTIARSALLAAASLWTIGMQPLKLPHGFDLAELVIAGLAELVVLGALSPEIGEALIRLGYSEPCELHDVPVDRTTSALHRSKQWRRTRPLITADLPADVWRELCWRYLVYPTSYADGKADIVFAVSLRPGRP
jgi:Methylamine utilisation protein MauE